MTPPGDFQSFRDQKHHCLLALHVLLNALGKGWMTTLEILQPMQVLEDEPLTANCVLH